MSGYIIPGVDKLVQTTSSDLGGILAPGSGGATSVSIPKIGDVLGYYGTQVSNKLGTTITNASKNLVSKTLGNGVLGQVAQQLLTNVLTASLAGNLNAMNSRADPQTNLDWALILPSLPGSPQLQSNGTGPELSGIFVEEISFGTSDFRVLPVNRGGAVINYASGMDIQEIQLTFYEDVFGSSTTWLDYWRQMIRNPDGTYNYPSEYKQDINFVALDPRKSQMYVIKLVGCFPTGGPSYAYGSGNTERTRPQQHFSCDHIVLYTASATIGNIQQISGSNILTSSINKALNIVSTAKNVVTNIGNLF